MPLSHTNTKRAALAVLCAALLGACDSGPPATGIDLETPVTELPAWEQLTSDLELTEPEQTKLSRWVQVFREGLDIARRGESKAERDRLEQQWWQEAERSLEVIVGPELVERVIAWLEETFERRGGES